MGRKTGQGGGRGEEQANRKERRGEKGIVGGRKVGYTGK